LVPVAFELPVLGVMRLIEWGQNAHYALPHLGLVGGVAGRCGVLALAQAVYQKVGAVAKVCGG